MFPHQSDKAGKETASQTRCRRIDVIDEESTVRMLEKYLQFLAWNNLPCISNAK